MEVTNFERNLKAKLYEEFPKHFDREGGDLVVTLDRIKALPKVRGAPDEAPKEALTFTVTIPLKAATAAAPAGRGRPARTPGG